MPFHPKKTFITTLPTLSAKLLLVGYIVLQTIPAVFAINDNSMRPNPVDAIGHDVAPNTVASPEQIKAMGKPPETGASGGSNFIPNVHLNYEIPGVKGQGTDSKGKTILDVSSIKNLQDNFIKPFFNTLFGIGGIIAVMGIALGGLQYMGAGASIGNVKEGQAKIFNAIMGVILLLSSFLLLRTINPQILGGVGTNKECKDEGQLEHPERAQNNSLCPIPKIKQSDVKVKTEFGSAGQQQLQKNETNISDADNYAKEKEKEAKADPNNTDKKRRAEEATLASVAVTIATNYTTETHVTTYPPTREETKKLIDSPYLNPSNTSKEYSLLMNSLNPTAEQLKSPTDPKIKQNLLRITTNVAQNAKTNLTALGYAKTNTTQMFSDYTQEQKNKLDLVIAAQQRILDAANKRLFELKK